ncbi:MAG TPA: hypothetical protein VMM78_16600 [Thermomicrobiales bacterium]|nr:hypothetical protein [Thermomicrobiales bacterium]
MDGRAIRGDPFQRLHVRQRNAVELWVEVCEARRRVPDGYVDVSRTLRAGDGERERLRVNVDVRPGVDPARIDIGSERQRFPFGASHVGDVEA